MASVTGLRFLRPYLHHDLTPASRCAYLRLYSSTIGAKRVGRAGINGTEGQKPTSLGTAGVPVHSDLPVQSTSKVRAEELEAANSLRWPRIKNDSTVLTVAEFLEKHAKLEPGVIEHGDHITVRGRLMSFRIAGSKLVFLDIYQDNCKIQVVLNSERVDAMDGTPRDQFKAFYHLIRRGDILSCEGVPYCTKRGELSISSTALPEIVSPSLALLPSVLTDPQTRIRQRHIDLNVNHGAMDTLKLRSRLIQHLRDFLVKDNFYEVSTPIIADKAGGAIARPFTTVASEFSPGRELALRIAPEIWLKRLMIGGMDRVFEIGPVFRNEGLDQTHNPEFTTCEFYKAFAGLDDLIKMTEDMLSGMAKLTTELTQYPLKAIPELEEAFFEGPYKRISFIPAIEEGLKTKLPDLAADDAQDKLVALFTERSIPLPSSRTLPRLLDKLSSIYIEPSCNSPTFITYHPACMAPLAKSFHDKSSDQVVSARAELFVNNKEIANMYEEENSPLEQRTKFEQQLKWKDEENEGLIDESYLEALESGLPPTGGWGCGLDRLVMMFSGTKRISDVLTFGSLKNVANLGSMGSHIPVELKEKDTKSATE